ncbi:MAG TPA: hypothetical protein VLX92_19370 [Kofleriaceae bacterium]|nr:hypothetical protein [Kofleriaceae bacterium]
MVLEDARHLAGAVRHAESRDVGALARLLENVGVDASALEAARRHPFGHVLIFELEGVVCAMVYVLIDHTNGVRGHLQLAVVDPKLAEHREVIEQRLIGVATALCEAYGCSPMDARSRALNVAAAKPPK